MAADGFDEKDLKVLARRAAALREKLRGYNGPLPFDRDSVLDYLALLADAPSPTDAQMVMNALSDIRRVVLDALVAVEEEEIEQDIEDIDVALAGLLGALNQALQPFAGQSEETEEESQEVVVADHATDIDAIRQLLREFRETVADAIRAFNGSPFAKAVSASVLASLINPWVLVGFAALYILAKLSEKKVGRRALEALLKRQEGEVTAFEAAVERNRQAVETVAGLYGSAKDLVTSARRKVTAVRQRATRIFGTGQARVGQSPPPEEPPEPRAATPEPEPEPPVPALPPSRLHNTQWESGIFVGGYLLPARY